LTEVGSMNTKNQLRRVAKLGITEFESTTDVRDLQADMLRRLERSKIDPGQYASLADCQSNHCAYKKCLEACWFGTRHRRLDEIPAIYHLLQNSKKPLYEVRFVRGIWARPAKHLRYAPITAAKKLNSRALDRLFMPTLVAIGTFKVSVEERYEGHLWICEIHQIVAGAEKDELQKVFSSRRQAIAISNKLWLQEVTDLGQTISKVFRRDLETWQDLERKHLAAEEPTKMQRREFYKWLLNLRPGARLIRYGCDRYFNKLENKKPRTFRATVRKPRPYPYHLKKYMFGCREEYGEDKYDPDETGPFDVVKSQREKHLQHNYPWAKIVGKKQHFDWRPHSRRRT